MRHSVIIAVVMTVATAAVMFRQLGGSAAAESGAAPPAPTVGPIAITDVLAALAAAGSQHPSPAATVVVRPMPTAAVTASCAPSVSHVVFGVDDNLKSYVTNASRKAAAREVRRCGGGYFAAPRAFPVVSDDMLQFHRGKAPRRVAAAVYAPLTTCASNMWHGTVDLLLPLAALYCTNRWLRCGAAEGAAAEGAALWALAAPPLLFVELTPRLTHFWGAASKGCPVMRRYPFGLINTTNEHSASAWAVGAVSQGLHFLHPGGAKHYFKLNMHNGRRAPAVAVARLALGLDLSCAAVPLGGSAAYPFYTTEGASRDTICAQAQQALRRLLAVPQPPRGAPPRRRLRVLYVPRVDGENVNGRRIMNGDAVLAALRRASAAGGADIVVQRFDGVSMALQRRLVADADVFVAGRGAATAHALFQPAGGAYVAMFPYAPGSNVSRAADNFPWWPFPLLRDDLSTGFVPCAAVDAELPPANAANCHHRSVNFCNMVCDPAAVAAALGTALRRIAAKQPVAHEFPEVTCENDTCRYVQASP
jgi:hypothetical protein